MELNRKAKGDLAELAVAADLRRRGHTISIPFGEDWDYDLIVGRAGTDRLERVQVKHAQTNGDVLSVRCCSHSLTNGRVRATKQYTAAMIDWLAAYDPRSGRCYYIPATKLGDGRRILLLRLKPARNGQRALINWAHDYETF